MDGKEITRQIEIRLAELGMKKKTFYELTGISSASFSQWNTGKTQPSAEAVRKINACLGTNFTVQSAVSDNMYETIQMLQDLSDEQRALLHEMTDMTPLQVGIVTEFARRLKEYGKLESN